MRAFSRTACGYCCTRYIAGSHVHISSPWLGCATDPWRGVHTLRGVQCHYRVREKHTRKGLAGLGRCLQFSTTESAIAHALCSTCRQGQCCRQWPYPARPSGAACLTQAASDAAFAKPSPGGAGLWPSAADFGLAGSCRPRPARWHLPVAYTLSLADPGFTFRHLMPLYRSSSAVCGTISTVRGIPGPQT